MPPALKNRPKLEAHLLGYYEAYHCLKRHRTHSEVGPNPISYESIVKYAEINGYLDDTETFDYFLFLLQACDDAYLDFIHAKQKKALSKMKSKS